MKTTTPTPADRLTSDDIANYRRDGFLRVRGIISPEEATHYRHAALDFAAKGQSFNDSPIFKQIVNVWREDETMKALTFHPNVAAVAQKLAGVPLRLWHDQILIKPPLKSKPTEFHQDQPYWPHATSDHPISCWIALCDVPAERGCMSFIPGSHRQLELQVQRLDDPRSLFSLCPELEYDLRVTAPLRAGDCTFHHGRCAHMATPNLTEEARVAHVALFMDATTTYVPRPHPVTDLLGFEEGTVIEGKVFPMIEEFARLRRSQLNSQ